METKKDILNQIKKTVKPVVPNEFFNDFSKGLLSKINNDSFIEKLPKTDRPEVPSDFFNDFSDNIKSKIDSPIKNKKGKIIPFVISLVSVAAILVLLFSVFKKSSTTIINKTELGNKNNTNMIKINEFEGIDNHNLSKPIAMFKLTDNSSDKEISLINLFSNSEQNQEDILFAELENEIDEFYYDF